MAIDVNTLRVGIEAIGRKLEAEHAMLTELDGRVGDGDLGLTLLKAFRAMDGIKDALPDDLGSVELPGRPAAPRGPATARSSRYVRIETNPFSLMKGSATCRR